LPKTMGVRKPEQWATRVARPLSWFLKFSLPLCRVAQQLNSSILKTITPHSIQPQAVLTDADYQELLEMAYQHGALAQEEKDIILQIISLDRRTAKEVMQPRSRMAARSSAFAARASSGVAVGRVRCRRSSAYRATRCSSTSLGTRAPAFR